MFVGPSKFFQTPKTQLSSFPPVSAPISPIARQHMQWMAICLSSSSTMSKSRRGKMRGRDKMTGVTVRVVFSSPDSFLKHLPWFWGEVRKEGPGS